LIVAAAKTGEFCASTIPDSAAIIKTSDSSFMRIVSCLLVPDEGLPLIVPFRQLSESGQFRKCSHGKL
jgi:hypothetical protein